MLPITAGLAAPHPDRTPSRTSARRRRLSTPREGGPDGGFSTLEAVILIPVLVIATMLAVQFAMLYHGRNVASAAARDGLRVARGYQATGQRGAADCTRYLAAVAGKMLSGPTCTATRTATTVTVSVHATVMSVVPFGSYHLEETATGPVEAFQAGG